MDKTVKRIIEQFFSKECKVRNTTIEELLKENHITEYMFWTVIKSEHIRVKSKESSIATSEDKSLLVEKIKKENEIRIQNQETLDIYRAIKDGTKTFGDVARERNCPVDIIYERLQSPYLKNVQNYSYEAIFSNNMELLRQRKEFEMYFYFLKHEVTFQQLAEHFQVEETDVIIYFDSIAANELSSRVIKKIFVHNKKCVQRQETPLENNQNTRNIVEHKLTRQVEQHKKLCKLFALTKKEIVQLDCFISTFQNKFLYNKEDDNYEQYRYIISNLGVNHGIGEKMETLNAVKQYLSNEFLPIYECFDHISIESCYARLRTMWVNSMLSQSILMKLKIRLLLDAKKVSTYGEERFCQIEPYLSIYVHCINTKKNKCVPFMLTHPIINFENSVLLDEQFQTTIFTEIAKIVNKMNDYNTTSKLYQYYESHFILFKDLAPIFHMETSELEQYYIENRERHGEWEKIKKIEQKRQETIQQAIERIHNFSNLIQRFQMLRKTNSIEVKKIICELENMIQNKTIAMQIVTQSHPFYFSTLVKSASFICTYLQQENYDANDLRKEYQIKSEQTENQYLYHPILINIIGEEVQQYIHNKRKIAKESGLKKQKVFIINKNYEAQARNEKGQFVKKYQSSSSEQ